MTETGDGPLDLSLLHQAVTSLEEQVSALVDLQECNTIETSYFQHLGVLRIHKEAKVPSDFCVNSRFCKFLLFNASEKCRLYKCDGKEMRKVQYL